MRNGRGKRASRGRFCPHLPIPASPHPLVASERSESRDLHNTDWRDDVVADLVEPYNPFSRFPTT
jgi:hypothetical protein